MSCLATGCSTEENSPFIFILNISPLLPFPLKISKLQDSNRSFYSIN
jgi:hypothetical protein